MKSIEKCKDRVYPCPAKDKGFTGKVYLEGLSLRYFAILLIKIYQNTLGFVFPQACRFCPSCSEYSIQALERHGFFKGGWLSVRRLLRCHPFNPGGYDPVE